MRCALRFIAASFARVMITAECALLWTQTHIIGQAVRFRSRALIACTFARCTHTHAYLAREAIRMWAYIQPFILSYHVGTRTYTRVYMGIHVRAYSCIRICMRMRIHASITHVNARTRAVRSSALGSN